MHALPDKRAAYCFNATIGFARWLAEKVWPLHVTVGPQGPHTHVGMLIFLGAGSAFRPVARCAGERFAIPLPLALDAGRESLTL